MKTVTEYDVMSMKKSSSAGSSRAGSGGTRSKPSSACSANSDVRSKPSSASSGAFLFLT